VKETPAIGTNLDWIRLDAITISKTNEMFRDSSDMSPEGLKELIISIQEQGILQPILLRQSSTGKYILVAGERRFQACKYLKFDEIPAFVRTMTEDEAFDLQLTENIQRKDVHPMREAKAYKFLQDSKKWTTTELAVRFGKSETYVAQRLKLNTLIDEAAKDFNSNYMSLGHAILIARLTPEDQKAVVKRCSTRLGKDIYYESIHELEDFIQDHIVRDLKEATFDTNDVNLVPKAGACVSCPKRSGFATQLFPDVKEKDRCFDGACFTLKKSIAIFAAVKKLVEEKPDTIFLESYPYHGEKVPQQIGSYLASQKIKTVDHDDWETSQSTWKGCNKKITGFVLNGDKAGRMITAWVKGAKQAEKKSSGSSGPEKLTKEDIKEAVARIKERTKRAAELDQEKVFSAIIEQITKHDKCLKDKEETPEKTLSEWGLMAALIYDSAEYGQRETIDKAFKLTSKLETKQEAHIFESLSLGQIMWMVRYVAASKYSSPFNHDKVEGVLIRNIAKGWGIDVDAIEKEQASIRTKREARAKERIEALQTELKPAKVKKSKAAA
jgi:ParB/RepB/Spo0J family partition protein